MESLKAEQATLVAHSNAEYEMKVKGLQDQLAALQESAEAGSKGLEEAVKARNTAEEAAEKMQGEMASAQREMEDAKRDLERVKKELQDVSVAQEGKTNKGDDVEVDKLKKIIDDLKGELEGHTEVSLRFGQ